MLDRTSSNSWSHNYVQRGGGRVSDVHLLSEYRVELACGGRFWDLHTPLFKEDCSMQNMGIFIQLVWFQTLIGLYSKCSRMPRALFFTAESESDLISLFHV